MYAVIVMTQWADEKRTMYADRIRYGPAYLNHSTEKDRILWHWHYLKRDGRESALSFCHTMAVCFGQLSEKKKIILQNNVRMYSSVRRAGLFMSLSGSK